ncbi:MAG: helix-turn-helix domain-containing protein [Bacteroidales bacterium]|nr:helix-turn-helix domain-containing protein [Bacteroidales bacterium]
MFRTDVVINEEQLEERVKVIMETSVSKSQKMKEMFDLGLELKAIASIMGVRYNFVYNVISNYVNINDIPISRSVGESKKDAIIQLFLQGQSNKEIAKALKLNYNYIYKVIRDFGERSATQAREALNKPEEQPMPENKEEASVEEKAPDSEPEPTGESEVGATVEESEPESEPEPARGKKPVQQTYWKGVEPPHKTGIAAFFANRRKA